MGRHRREPPTPAVPGVLARAPAPPRRPHPLTAARRAVAWVLVGLVTAGAAAGAALGVAMAPTRRPPSLLLSGPLRAPGGPFLYDRFGRVVILHGVNVVYKRPPYEVYPDPKKPWNFDVRDARRLARLGFDVVRLGVTWAGLEPGTAPANDPSICRSGRPGDPHQFDAGVLRRYLDRLSRTVAILARFHIYSLLDMHQDVYNRRFDGEGEPTWAVCTDGVQSVDPPGRWSLEYGTKAAGIAFHHFWTNDVRGNLQGQYDMVWGDLAKYFAHDPWVIGFDPFNEPFSTSLIRVGDAHFDGELECFYTGRAHIGRPSHRAPPIHCPPGDPRTGVIPVILRNAPHKLVFDEPDNFASRGYPTFLGPMDLPNLVFNVHIYCSDRNPMTGNPTDIAACLAQDDRSLARRAADRPLMASPRQRRGPAWFVTEFGATSDPSYLASLTALFNQHLVGWAYWSWKYYGDPTGSRDEALVTANGRLRPTARALAQTYARAIAGTPLSISDDPATGAFVLRYRASRRVRAPTVVFVPTHVHYAHGYCVHVTGGRVVSSPGSTELVVRNGRRAHVVVVRVRAGRCARR